MPLYDYQCSACDKVFANVFRDYEERDNGPVCCGAISSKVWLTSPGVIGARAFDAFVSPASGKVIRTEAQYKDDLARSNCVPYEPGIKQDQERRVKNQEAETSQLVEKIVSEAAERAQL